jgi:hypothetical protein
MHLKPSWALLLMLVVAASSVLKADVITNSTSRSTFGGTDTVDWGQLGGCNQNVANSFTATSVGGLAVTGSESSGHVMTMIQANADGSGGCVFGGWSGNFAPQANLLYSGFAFGGSNGPITLNFSGAIAGVGTQFDPSVNGDFQAEIDAYSGSTLIGKVTGNGTAGLAGADNSAMFLGLQDVSGANITSVVIKTPLNPGDVGDFAINELSLILSGSSTGSGDTPTPEPRATMMLLVGLGLVAVARRGQDAAQRR